LHLPLEKCIFNKNHHAPIRKLKVKTNINIWRVATVIITVLAVFVVTYGFQLYYVEKENSFFLGREKASLTEKLYKFYAEKKEAQSKLEIANKEKNELSGKVDEYKNNAEILENEIGELKARLLGESKKDEELEILRKKVDEYEKENVNLKEKLIMAMKSQVSQDPIKLEPITVASEKWNSGKNGEILEVNKQYDFVIIDLGEKDGLQKDDILSVFRKNKLLGTILIERTGQSVSVGRALYKSLKDVVRRGDKVIY